MGSDELRALYNEQYIAAFEQANQSGRRLGRLLSRLTLTLQDDFVDFACASGLLLPLVAGRVRHYTGVDYSEDFIAAARSRQAHLGIANACFECTSLEAFAHDHRAQFQVGFAFDFSEHVPDAEWVDLLATMRATLAPGGLLYLHTPNAGFMVERLKARNFILKQFTDHVGVRTLSSNTALLTRAGFRIRRAEYLPHYNVLRFIHPLSVLPLVGPLFRARIFIEAVRD
jgi:cyclopropane fatty-acyl-phospholipid synthase-like methyltransferase